MRLYLHALLATDSNSNVGRFDHGNVVGSITNRERDGLFVLFDQIDHHGLLEGSHPAANHRFAWANT